MSAKLLTESTKSDFAKSGMPLANSTNAPLPMLSVRIRQSPERSKDGEGSVRGERADVASRLYCRTPPEHPPT